jgi:hypothetical protein
MKSRRRRVVHIYVARKGRIPFRYYTRRQRGD